MEVPVFLAEKPIPFLSKKKKKKKSFDSLIGKCFFFFGENSYRQLSLLFFREIKIKKSGYY